MATCSRCANRKGLRVCPKLGASICSRCCGESRLVRIACPPRCPHLVAHEAFQRAKQGARFRQVLADVCGDLRERGDEVHLLVALADLVDRAAQTTSGLSDSDVVRALGEVATELSPISLVAQAPSPLARRLGDELRPLVAEGKLGRERLRDGLARLGRVAHAMEDPGAPRAFLQGLSAYVGETLPKREGKVGSGLILMPDDLRRARG